MTEQRGNLTLKSEGCAECNGIGMIAAPPFIGGLEPCPACALAAKAPEHPTKPTFGTHVALSKFERCESPIEQLFVLALMFEIEWLRSRGTRGLTFDVQREIGRYRVDVVVEFGEKRAVVECDGHDFHERTKEQAASDKRRDRDLQVQGFLVLRFTGSEIHADPERCAEEALRAVGATLDQQVLEST